MAFIDLTLILEYTISLLIVALPVEAGILFYVRRGTQQVTNPELRSELIGEAAELLSEQFKDPSLIREVAKVLWEPLNTPLQRQALIGEVVQAVWEPFSTPEARQKIISEGAHGFMRALKERGGSLEGVAARVAKAGIIDAITEGGAAPELLGKLPGTVKLPVVGKVSIGDAIQIGNALKQLFSGGGGQLQLPSPGQTSAGSTAGYPP